MAVLIHKNGKSNNCNSIMDQMSELKLKMNILQGLIEADKSTSKTRDDKLSLLREQMLVSKMRDSNTSLLREHILQHRS